MNIPRLCEFSISGITDAVYLSVGLPMSKVFREKMICENLRVNLSDHILLGGFHNMGKYFKYKDVLNAIKHYRAKDDRRFRFGTLSELFIFSKQNTSVCPEYFVIFDDIFDNIVLYHDGDFSRFDIADLNTVWCPHYQVFIVEEVHISLSRY